MTINQRTTLLVCTGAMVVGAFCAAAPAQAADAYVALSYSLQSKVSGMAVAATKDATNSIVEMARKQALSKNGGGVIGASGCTTNLVVDSPPQSPDTGPADPQPDPQPVPDDYDNDGLSKHDEIFTTHTNPFRADTDFDGVNDGDEYRNGTNPLDPRSP